MRENRKLRLRAFYHGLKLIGAGIIGDKKIIAKYIEINGNPNRFDVQHMGDNYPGQIIYVIREQGMGFGFCAEVKVLLEQLLVAEQYGFTPKVQYGKDYLYWDGASENAFEQFFEPIGKDININNTQNVIYSRGPYAFQLEEKYAVNGYQINEELKKKLAESVRKYMRINDSLLGEYDNVFQTMMNGKKVLGVHYRGGDFKQRYFDHPTPVDLEQTREEIDKALQGVSFDSIFLATDDSDAVDYFQKIYDDKLVYFTDVVRTAEKQSVALQHIEDKRHQSRIGYEVLRDFYFLSRCDGLVGGVSQVTFCAQVFKKSRDEQYDYLYIIDNGINTKGKRFRSKRNK